MHTVHSSYAFTSSKCNSRDCDFLDEQISSEGRFHNCCRFSVHSGTNGCCCSRLRTPRRLTSTQVAVRHLVVLEARRHSIGSDVRYRFACCDSGHLLHAARLLVLVLHEPCTSSLQCMPECVLLQQGTSVWTLACPPRDMLCVARQANANHLPRPQTWLSHSFITSVLSLACWVPW